MSSRSSCLRYRRPAGIAAVVGGLLLSAGWTAPTRRDEPRAVEAFWRVGVPRPIAVRDGRATFRVPTRGPSSQTLVVISALGRGPGPFPIRLAACPAPAGAIPEPADDGPLDRPSNDAMSPVPAPTPPAPADRLPPRERAFHLMARPGDPASADSYLTVRGVLRGAGRRVQVYVAADDVATVPRSTIRDVITTFDDRVYPEAAARHGGARDVDGDGRFTVLFSSWLDRLGGGRHAVDGFVKVADLDATVPSPFGNRCDMVYLNAALSPGPYLRTVLAHEYMHAVAYTAKTLDPADGAAPGPEEEGWLDEAIAHLAEDLHGFSSSNIDYRVSAFLSAPERYRLVVDDYFAANLFRSHGNRGSTYLFLRWCVDRYGPGLISRLIRSPRRGVANVEAATGSTFAGLFRRWSLAMFLSGLDPSDTSAGEAGDGFRSLNLRAPWADGELAGPRHRRLTPGDRADAWEAAGTSIHYVIVDGDAAGAVELEVSGPADAGLQVTAVPIGDDRARVTLSIRAARGPDGGWEALARMTEHNGVPVRITAMSWEPTTPGPRPSSVGGRLDMLGVAAAFGTSALPAGGERDSRPIPLPGLAPEDGPIVVKLLGTDPIGRHVTAWADLDLSNPMPAGH